MSATSENGADHATRIVEIGIRNAAALSESAQAIVSETAAYTRSSIETAIAAAEKLAAAQSVESALAIQAAFVRSSYESLVAEGTKLAGLYADLAKRAYVPFETMVARPR